LIRWITIEENIYFKKFALQRGYTFQRLSEFVKANEKFAEAYEIARDWQECKLVENGLHNHTNAAITKFVLTNKHGWSERNETQLKGDAANPLEFLLNSIDGTSKDLNGNE
jgi:hypothetical protein